MPLDIPAGATIFIDSTIFHYAFVEFPNATPQCIHLLSRIGSGELSGCSSLPVLNDAVHKVMCSEAKQRFNQPRAGLVNWMKNNPNRVRELTSAPKALRLMKTLPIEILSVDLNSLDDAQRAVRVHGLLASDAMILSLMGRRGITHLATNDDDFGHIPGLTVWKPR